MSLINQADVNSILPSEDEVNEANEAIKLPHSLTAECGVIGCVVKSASDCLEPAMRRIESPDAFHDRRHMLLWRTVVAMASNGGVDSITLYQKLRDKGLLTDAGGEDYITKLLVSVTDSTPSALESYLNILCEKYDLRRIAKTCNDLSSRVYSDEGDIESIVSYLKASARKLSKRTSLLPQIEDTFDMAESIIPLPSELVDGILHQGTKMAVGGGSKASKTWILMDLALSISYGVPWLGYPTMESPVLYLNFEIQRGFTRRRIMKIAEAKGITLQPGKLDIWNLRDHDASYDKVIPQIIERIKTRGYSLVVFDPIYKAYGNLDENKAGDIAKLMNAFGRLNSETGAALAFAAHFSKGNQSQKEAMDRISGSGVFGRDPDSLITFTAHENEDCFTIDGTLRNLPRIKPFVVQWVFPLMVPQNLDPAKLKKAPGRPSENSKDDILPLLPAEGLTSSEWKAACLEDGIKERTFFRLIKELKTSNKITRLFSNGKWVLNPLKTQSA